MGCHLTSEKERERGEEGRTERREGGRKNKEKRKKGRKKKERKEEGRKERKKKKGKEKKRKKGKKVRLERRFISNSVLETFIINPYFWISRLFWLLLLGFRLFPIHHYLTVCYFKHLSITIFKKNRLNAVTLLKTVKSNSGPLN